MITRFRNPNKPKRINTGSTPHPKLLSLVIAQALALQAAQAATIEVTSNLDDGTGCTLREAIESVNSGALEPGCSNSGGAFGDDIINFAPSVQGSTITLAGSQLEIYYSPSNFSSVSINPTGSQTTITANGASRVLYVNSDSAQVNLNQLVITGGSDYQGAGITIEYSVVSLTDSIISGNSAAGYGGGLYSEDESTITLTNSTVSGNTADYKGGGIYTYSAVLELTNSTVSGNSAGDDGGGILVAGESSLYLTDSTLLGNRAGEDGGGVEILNDTTATISNSTITGNTAADDSGGIGLEGDSSAVITRTTVSNNSAADEGGGLRVSLNSSILMTNSTVSGNTAGNRGGGMRIRDESSIELFNVTVSDNSAPLGGGVYLLEIGGYNPPELSLTNSIIANSLGGDDCERSAATDVINAGVDNIIETDSCGTSAQAVDSGLMPLADNGGDTQTHALMPGSPAIDGSDQAQCVANLTPLEDQRGEARDDGACDIGAYEFSAMVLPIARQDREMGSLMSGGEQWYSFDSTESQRLSMQTNGFEGDTLLDFYTGNDPKTASPLSNDDNGGPELFSNIRQNVDSGPHLIRVTGRTDVIPYWLRLMSDRDILSFTDTASHFANREIRVMSSAGITGGCGVNIYCPTDPVTRAQMAIFMLKAILGGNHVSPAATGTVFNDVSTSSFGANFIEEFSTLGITSGCGGGNYCPDLAVTREQMAIFLLRAWYGSGYTPPVATPAEIAQFSDISNSFARDWIVQLTKEGITGGCGGGKFCPTDTVTRGQMAAFITRTFSLDTEL